MSQRKMPSALEAEASLLGTMMIYKDGARDAIEEGLTEQDFYNEANRRIFRVIAQLYHEGIDIDITSVYTRLNDLNMLDQMGGLDYLNNLAATAVTNAYTKTYVHMIQDKALVRNMIETADKISQEGLEGQADVGEYLDNAEKAILGISRNRRTTAFKTSSELVTEAIKEIQRMSDNKSSITGLKTGYRDLDRTTHGFQNGDLIILAARPSMGKTAVALNIALHAALFNPKKAIAIFSLEMPANQLQMRLLSAHSRVKGDNLRTGFLDAEEWNRVNEAASELKMLNIFIDDTSMLRTTEIFSKCRRLQAEQDLALVVIDYIQLISSGTSGRGDFNRQQEISEISRNLKALARELNVPVLVLSQLSRNVESREGKKPMLSDLRESGAIEQDADLVMLLYRDAYYNEEAKKVAEETGTELLEINIAKHRNGATRRFNVVFESDTNAMMNLENGANNQEE